MNLYERIKKIADEKNVSIYRIEIETGLSNGSISKWNQSQPNSVSLFKVAEYLDVDPKELMKDSK